MRNPSLTVAFRRTSESLMNLNVSFYIFNVRSHGNITFVCNALDSRVGRNDILATQKKKIVFSKGTSYTLSGGTVMLPLFVTVFVIISYYVGA